MTSKLNPIELIAEFLNQQKELFGGEIGFHKHSVCKTNNQKTPVQKVTPNMTQSVKSSESIAETNNLVMELPALSALEETVSHCRKCTLCETRTQTVFGSGNFRAGLMFIGEAPGADEDAQGLPFVGRAGQLLTKMIEEPRSLGIPRAEVYIANILKCRPPNNRKPSVGEIEHCEPYLITQIETIRPKIICALGLTAANTLLRNDLSMTALREKIFDYHGVPLVVSYHPAALLRNPNWKKPAWDDMIRIKELMLNN
jgi:uracil-DNA glycosylase